MNANLKNLELQNDFNTIINIATKALKAPIIVIAIVNKDSFELSSNHASLNGITFDRTNAFLEQCLTLVQIEIHQNTLTKELGNEEKSYISIPLSSKTGNKTGFIVAIDASSRKFSSEDVLLLTDIAEIAASTIEKYISAQKLQEVFTDFVHKTVHDLKNPFTTISLTTELLKRKPEDAKLVTSFSQRLENANNKVFKNLDRLKSAFFLNNDGFKLNIQEINVDDLFSAVKSQISSEITTKNELKDKIFGDYSRLNEAIIQLTNHLLLVSSNCSQFFLKSYSTENKIILELSNINTGDRFQDLEDFSNSTSLSIAKKMAEMHYGSIKISKEETADDYQLAIVLPLTDLQKIK